MPASAEPVPQKPAHSVLRPLANERGVALLLALAMLAIMTVIGVFALDTSTTEVQISGNYRTSQETFFAADRAVMFALGEASFPYKAPTGGADPNDPAVREANTRLIKGLGSEAVSTIVASGTPGISLKQGTIECIFKGTEIGAGQSETFPVQYYLVSAVVGGPNGSEARVEVQSKWQAGNGGSGNNVFDIQ